MKCRYIDERQKIDRKNYEKTGTIELYMVTRFFRDFSERFLAPC